MTFQSIPLFGLTEYLAVVRFADADDGAGGIVPQGTRTVLYADWHCRITTLSTEDTVKMGYVGSASAHTFKVIGVPVQNIKQNDFLEVPFGVLPNFSGVASLGEGFPYEFSANSVVLSWDGTQYIDGDEEHVLSWSDGSWTYIGPDLEYSWDISEDCPPFDVWERWTDGPELDYLGPIQRYRVMWVKPQINEFGTLHHTALIVELENSNV